MGSFWQTWKAFWHHLEEWAIAAVLVAMIGLSSADILLRVGFDSGISWAQPVVKALVLWLAMLGALLATRSNQHIAIDVLSRFLPPLWRRFSQALVTLFAAVICAVLAWHSYRFVAGSFEFQDRFLRGIPAWWVQAIMPFGFGLMSLRFAGHAFAYALVPDYRPEGQAKSGEML